MSARKLAKKAAWVTGADASKFDDFSSNQLKKLIGPWLNVKVPEAGDRKKGGSVSRKKGSNIMQGYKAGGKV